MFVGRQRRLRIGDSWFRVDLLFFHRRLRCLVIIDLNVESYRRRKANDKQSARRRQLRWRPH
ncbi:PDDEXK nuclease domain-containing protein [Paraburkholderia strydomiana]|uniref:PDDEXK nuclease domain-containing protein n=1 Tax=Paraburkholderia strydomiana TaxID=1245417 RepID=UPI0038B8826B